MSFATQMLGLTVQNFLSAATGMAMKRPVSAHAFSSRVHSLTRSQRRRRSLVSSAARMKTGMSGTSRKQSASPKVSPGPTPARMASSPLRSSMLSAALLELLPDPEDFVARLNGLSLPGVRFAREKSVKCGVTGTHLSVTVDGAEEDEPHGHEHV